MGMAGMGISQGGSYVSSPEYVSREHFNKTIDKLQSILNDMTDVLNFHKTYIEDSNKKTNSLILYIKYLKICTREKKASVEFESFEKTPHLYL